MNRGTLTILDPKKSEWFLSKDRQQVTYQRVCYAYVICHSLLNYLAGESYDYAKGEEALKDLLASLGSQKQKAPPKNFRKEGFMELLPLDQDFGFVIVDQADGMYPLVCYSDERVKKIQQDTETKANYKDRAKAFKAALRNVLAKYYEIHRYLKDRVPDDWNQEFQEGLFERTDGFVYIGKLQAAAVA